MKQACCMIMGASCRTILPMQPSRVRFVKHRSRNLCPRRLSLGSIPHRRHDRREDAATIKRGENIMRRLDRFILALAIVGSFTALPAFAQQQTFYNESQPMFDNCGDPSLAKAQKEGITLGFSVKPPEAWLDEQTKEAK